MTLDLCDCPKMCMWEFRDHVVVARSLIWSRGKLELPLWKKDMPIGYPFGVVECTQQPHDLRSMRLPQDVHLDVPCWYFRFRFSGTCNSYTASTLSLCLFTLFFEEVRAILFDIVIVAVRELFKHCLFLVGIPLSLTCRPIRALLFNMSVLPSAFLPILVYILNGLLSLSLSNCFSIEGGFENMAILVCYGLVFHPILVLLELALMVFREWLLANNISICFCCLYEKLVVPLGNFDQFAPFVHLFSWFVLGILFQWYT